ncbi:hypothetical protein [Microbulbifer sp. JMSA003]|uniref:hypothetical protein n=1 Tax=Microbulbifer sp. JMSA003 TaxID=3243369 RepID=UPI00403958BD
MSKIQIKNKEKNIGKKDFENIKDTLEAYENLIESSGTYAKILAKYIAALMIALLATIAKTMSVVPAFLTVFGLGVFGYLIYQIATVVPAPLSE